MRRAVRIAHQETPRRSQLRVDVGPGPDPVLAQARDQYVDAFDAARIVRSLGLAGDETGVINEKVHVGIALRHAADVHAGRVRIRLRAKRQALVHGDLADAELPRLFYHRDADVVIQEKAFAVRPPLRIRLPRSDRVACGELVHPVEIARLIRVHPAMQQHPVRALHALDDLRRCRGFLDRQRLPLARRRHE